MDDGQQLALAASQFVGIKFRLNGRDPGTGLDCVGLVFASLKAIGRNPSLPRGYSLRNSRIDHWLGCASSSGFERVADETAPGDVMLIAPAPGQHHLCITENAGTIIHAHAGLRRVVRQPWHADTDEIMRWRLASSRKDS